MLLYSLCVTVLVLPMGVMPQDESPNPSSGSGSGSGTIFVSHPSKHTTMLKLKYNIMSYNGPLFFFHQPLTTLSSLTQLQKDNLVTIGFTGMTVSKRERKGLVIDTVVILQV